MSNLTMAKGSYVTLTSYGEQTGHYLQVVQASINTIDAANPHLNLESEPLTPGTSGGIALSLEPNTTPFVIEFPPVTYEGDTSPTPEGYGVPAGVRDKVYLIPAGIPQFTIANGGDGQTTVAAASPLNYSGAAALVDAFGGSSSIVASGSNQTVAAGGKGNVVTLQGNGDQFFVDSGSDGTYTDSGSKGLLVIGSTGSQQPTAPSAMTKLLVNAGDNDIRLIDPTANDYVVLNSQPNTVQGMAGSETISALSAGNVFDGSGGAANAEFVSSATGVNTVITGSGNDTVFGEGGVDYTAGSGNDLYVGGTGAAIINGGTGNQTLFGGTGGEMINVGGSHDIIVSGGGRDAIMGGSNPVTLFGNNGGNNRLVNTATGSILVAAGAAETVDASAAGPGNNFFVNDVPSTGNTTLVGSSSTSSTSSFSDLFVVQSVAGGNNAPHTLTIEGFHTGDAFFLSGYGAGDERSFANAVNNDPTPTGNLAVALSDGTTVQFVGGHPINIFNGGSVAT